MIGLDTNVLLRMIVQDDETQTEQTKTFIKKQRNRGEKFLVSDIVLCETVWTLKSAYKLNKRQLIVVIESVLEGFELIFESSDRIAIALDMYERGKADFADYLIGHSYFELGCTSVATFDKALLKEKGFVGVEK